MTTKKILFLIDELEVGGLQRQILLLAKAFKDAGHHVSVGYFRDANAVLKPAFEDAGIEVHLIAKTRGVDPLFVARLARFLARDRERHVLSFGYTANLWSRLAGAKPIACIRNLGYLPRSSGKTLRAMVRVERLLARRSRWVVANSSVTAESIVARGIIPKKRLLVIPNAVEKEKHAPRDEARARLQSLIHQETGPNTTRSGASGSSGSSGGSARTGPIIGTLARLVEPKDLATLVRAARHVVDQIRDARFVIGGEGPDRSKLESLRRDLNLEDHFFLPGTLTGREVMTGLDVAVLSSSSEGMPNFVLEAMAAGVPVVSTRVGAASELLEEGKLGVLVKIGDDRALADGIVDVLRSPDEAQARAKEATTKALTMSPAEIASRYLALFDR